MNTTPRESSKRRREALLVVIVVCLALAQTAHGFAHAARAHDTGRDTPRQAGDAAARARPPRLLHKPSGLRKFAMNVERVLMCESANKRKKLELLSYGPEGHYDPNDFYILALVSGGSPMMLEYVLGTQSAVTITVKVMNEPPFTRALGGDGADKIRGEFFVLPNYTVNGPQPALISFRTEGRDKGGPPPDFSLVIIGAGAEAITTSALTRPREQIASVGGLPASAARDTPSQPRAPRHPQARVNLSVISFEESQGKYIYKFSVGYTFDRWGMEVFRREDLRHSVREDSFIEAIGPYAPYLPFIQREWDGLNNKKRPVRPGGYKVRISVWDSSDDGSWAIATRADKQDSSLIIIR